MKRARPAEQKSLKDGVAWSGKADLALMAGGAVRADLVLRDRLLLILEISGDGANIVWVMDGNPTNPQVFIVLIIFYQTVQRRVANLLSSPHTRYCCSIATRLTGRLERPHSRCRAAEAQTRRIDSTTLAYWDPEYEPNGRVDGSKT